jgi:hypothetical protein
MTARYKTKKQQSPIKAIKEMCIQCMGTRENVGYQQLIESCASSSCPNYAFRFGANPYNKKTLTNEQRKKRADRLSVSVSVFCQDSWENQN